CWGAEATCARSRNCSAMPACPPPRSIQAWTRRGFWKSTTLPIRAPEHAILRDGLTVSPLLTPIAHGMKKNAVADRAAAVSLQLIAIANLLFALTFLAVLFFATNAARAEQLACTGTNLLADLEANDPTLLAEIRSEA